jgi:hypothetical protein
MSINKFITNLDLARQAEIMSGETAVFQGGIELGIPFSGFPSGVDTSTIVSLGIVGAEFAAFSGNTGTTVFNVTDPSSPYYSVSATTLSASPYTIIDDNSITETVSATTYPTIMTFTALSGDCCSTPISVSFTPPIIQELYDRGLYDGLFDGLGQASIGTTYIDESFYNVGSVFSGANLNMEIVEYGVHGATPAWVTGTTSGTVVEYSALTQYWVDPIYENLTSGLTLPITPESADTQTSDYVWTLTDSTIIDENLVGLQYTGYSVTYSFNDVIIDPESPSITGGVTGATSADTYYLGTVTATLENYSAGTLDYKGSTNWLIVNGSATIDERLTTDRMTIHTLGTGSPVTMLGVDVNGNVVGGSGGTTDDTGAFTSTTANNTIIPTNAAGNTNDSDYASILAGQNNTISGTSTSSAIVGGENNVVKDVSDFSIIAGGEDNTISGHTHSFIIGGSGNTINFSPYVGDGEGILGSTFSTIEGSKNTSIQSSKSSGIYKGQTSSILSSVNVNIYNNNNVGTPNGLNTIIGSEDVTISGTPGSSTETKNNTVIGGNPSYTNLIKDSKSSSIVGGGGTIDNITMGGIFASNAIISGSSSVFWSAAVAARNAELYDSNTSIIIGGSGNYMNDSGSSLIAGGDGNVMDTSDHSAIVGGVTNVIDNALRSVILGGQNITGTTDDTVYMNNLYITQANGGNYYSDMDNSSGPTVVLSGSSSDLTRLTVTEGSGSSFGLGIRGATEVSFPGYGKQGDAYIYSTIGNNGINIISAAGSGTDDYIRFYAGGDASTLTNSDLMIVGSGLTRGNVGIGTDTPTEKLDIDGNLKVSGEITASGIPSYADDAAAGVGGLSTGEVYQTDGTGASPLNVAGILMIKQ